MQGELVTLLGSTNVERVSYLFPSSCPPPAPPDSEYHSETRPPFSRLENQVTCWEVLGKLIHGEVNLQYRHRRKLLLNSLFHRHASAPAPGVLDESQCSVCRDANLNRHITLIIPVPYRTRVMRAKEMQLKKKRRVVRLDSL
jgi:hypothetical protein